MKAFFKKIIDILKIVGLFIKRVIKKILNFFVRTLYIFIAIGYIAAIGTVYYSQDYIKEYNEQAIYYAGQASSGYKSYEAVRNIDKIVKQKLNERYKTAEKNISSSIKNINEKKLAQELLFGKKIEKTSFVKDIKSEVKSSFEIDISKEIKSTISQQPSHPILVKIADLFASGKLTQMVLILLSFPFLSPIVLACVVLSIMSKKYLKYFSNPNEANYINMVPSLYIVNMVLAFVAVTVFYFNANIGLAVAAIAHLLFILKVFNGIRLKNIGHCTSCNQAFPDEMEEIKKIKEQVKPKSKKKTK
ncbi:MAG TPA: hypothetical protein DCL21_06925 [Alphaproteobacteria bacterium]|nr:hypothetical protein [Alphaproteobacteria bacterium]